MSKSPLYARMNTSPYLLGVCSITGISLEIKIPYICGKVLEYENPLARIENARDIALLPYTEQAKIAPSILAGCLLTILCHYDRIQDKLSSTQRNEILSTVPVYYICETMRFFSSIPAKKIFSLPELSLDSDSTKLSTTLDLLKNYVRVCREKLEIGVESTSTSYIRTEKVKKAIRVESLTQETKDRAKKLVQQLIEAENFNPKVVTLLKTIVQKDTLITLHDSIRNKLVEKLSAYPSKPAQEFSLLLKQVGSNLSVQERIFKQQDDESLDRLSDSFTSIKRKSLAEIIAEKLGKAKESIETPTIEVIEPSEPTIIDMMLEAEKELIAEEQDKEEDYDLADNDGLQDEEGDDDEF